MTRKHWTDSIKAENERLRAEIAELKLQPQLADFAATVGNSIMVILANTPYNKWPLHASTALAHEARKVPVLGQLYLSRLPKA